VKWVRLIAGTPIENDLIVNMANAIRATTTALVADRDEALSRIAYLEEEIVRIRDVAIDHNVRATTTEAALATANARIAGLEKALAELVSAFDHARLVPSRGVGGMTIKANIRNSVYHGVPAWPVEEARAALTGGEDASP
jgi:hypothetical protein